MLGSTTLNRHFFLAGHKWLATDKSPRVQPTASSERNGVHSEGARDGEPCKMHYEGKKVSCRVACPSRSLCVFRKEVDARSLA